MAPTYKRDRYINRRKARADKDDCRVGQYRIERAG
jgi:hypothetical protein